MYGIKTKRDCVGVGVNQMGETEKENTLPIGIK